MEAKERRRLVAIIVAGLIADRGPGFTFLVSLGFSGNEALEMDPIKRANAIVDAILKKPVQS